MVGDASSSRRSSTVDGSVLGVREQNGTERNAEMRSIYNLLRANAVNIPRKHSRFADVFRA